MKLIFLFLTIYSVVLAEFSRSNGMVTDGSTGLIWQDDVTPDRMTWNAAISYCENLTLGDHTDWRLPNLNELDSLVDDSTYNPATSPLFVNIVSNQEYWSSTTRAQHRFGSDDAWTIGFFDGGQYIRSKTFSTYLRCVRVGP